MKVMWKKNNNLNMHGISEIAPSVPAFLVKLWKLVDDPDCDLIYWSESGLSFIIVAQARFAREVLPLHYKHNNMASFIRQLNMYDFHKIVSVESGGLKNDRDDMEFAHQYFIRDHPYLLENIKRKLSNPKSGIVIADQNVTSHIKNGSQSDLLTKVLSDVNILKEKQESWDAKLAAMKRENEALWRELAIFRQKHLKQEQIINRLIHFIVTIVQPSRNVSIRRRFPLMLNDTQYLKKIAKIISSSGSQLSDSSLTGPTIHEIDTSDVIISNSDENNDCISNVEYVSTDFLEPTTEYIQVISPESQVTINETTENESVNDDENPSNWLEVVLTEDNMIANPLASIDPAKVNPAVAAATVKKLENRNKKKTPITIKIPSIVSAELAKKKTIPEKKIIYLTEVKKPNKFQKKRSIRQSSIKNEPSKMKSSFSQKNNKITDSQNIVFDLVSENAGSTVLKPVTFPRKDNGYEKRKLPNTISSGTVKFPNKKLLIQAKSNIKDITSETSSQNCVPTDDSFWKLESLYNNTLKVDTLPSQLEKEENVEAETDTDKKEEKNFPEEKTSNLDLCEIDNSIVELSNLSPKNDAENEELNFSSDSMAVACQPLQPSDNEELSRYGENMQLSSHVDNVQGEIDYLKEVLKGEGYNLDMNGILELFNDDPLSYGMLPTTDEELKGKENEKEVTGNELMTYGTPNLMDLIELFGSTGTVQDWNNIASPISPTVSELTTPAPSPSTFAKSPKRRKI